MPPCVSAQSQSSLIYPPRRDIRDNLQANMGLLDNPELFNNFTGSLRSLAHSMLEPGKAYSAQCKHKWEAFVKRAHELHPFLFRYVDGWPVKAYMQRVLLNTIPRKSPITNKQKLRGPRIINRSGRSGGDGLLPRTRGDQVNIDKAPPADVIIIDDDSPELQDPLAFRNFVRGLHLRLDADGLVRCLLVAGVTNKDQLADILAWDEHTRRAFFMLDLRMNYFQYHSLVDRLRAKFNP